MPAARCASCPNAAQILRDEHDGFVEVLCAGVDPSYVNDAVGVVHLRRARTAELMSRDFARVSPDLPVDELVHLFVQGGHKSLPVVGTQSQALGRVEEADVHLSLHLRGEATHVVADVMSPLDVTVREDTPISLAAAAFLSTQASWLPVLAGEHTLVGILDVRDVMRWIALGDGYVVGESAR